MRLSSTYVQRTKEGYKQRHEVREVCLERFEDVEEALLKVREKESVVLRFSKVPDTLYQRMLDFVSGAVFMVGGTVKRVDENCFILIPKGIKITKLRK